MDIPNGLPTRKVDMKFDVEMRVVNEDGEKTTVYGETFATSVREARSNSRREFERAGFRPVRVVSITTTKGN